MLSRAGGYANTLTHTGEMSSCTPRNGSSNGSSVGDDARSVSLGGRVLGGVGGRDNASVSSSTTWREEEWERERARERERQRCRERDRERGREGGRERVQGLQETLVRCVCVGVCVCVCVGGWVFVCCVW